MRRLLVIAAAASAVLLVFAAPAAAQEAEMATQVSLNTVFFLLCTVLVFLMHPGFAMLEAGFTGSANAANIMMKNMMVIALGFITYFAIGWGLHYGTSVLGLFGGDEFFLLGTYGSELAGDPFLASEFMFDAVFAATAATIISGAVAGRMNLWGFMILAAVMTALVYPIVGHWAWGGGWLEETLGFHDFAGSTVVHLTGGIAALTAAAMLGPRLGKFDKQGRPRTLPGHSAPLGTLGAFLLFFGWFGFNGGSVLNAEVAVGPVLLTTALAASAGGITAAVVSALRYGGRTNVALTANGLLAGLVGITAGADVLAPYAAVLVGIAAGILVIACMALVERMGIDDAVGAFSVHGACGVLGTVWVGLLSMDAGVGLGILYGGDPAFLGAQVIGPVAVAVFVAASTAAVCAGLRATGLLRVTDEALQAGLDVHEHGELGYPEGMLVGGNGNGNDA